MEEAVIIIFPLSGTEFGSAWELEVLGSLGDDLADVILEAGVGEFDGHDVGEGEYTLYLYGPDADDLFDAVKPLLTRQPWTGEVAVVKRYGEPGAAEVRVSLNG